MKLLLFLLSVVLAVSTRLTAQSEDPKFADYLTGERQRLPNDGKLLYNCAVVNGYSMGAGNSSARLQQITVNEADIPFTRAYSVTVTTPGDNPWEPQILSPSNTSAIKHGDMLFWIFWVRGVAHPENEESIKASFYAQLTESPWTGIALLSKVTGKPKMPL